MTIYVSTSSGVPIYRQIMKQIEQMIAAGRLSPGAELLPIRTLAQQLVVNPNTVARAYRDLELKGVLVSKQGAGTYVAENRPVISKEDRLKLLGDRLDEVVAYSRQLGIESSMLAQMLGDRIEGETPSETSTPRSPFDDEFID